MVSSYTLLHLGLAGICAFLAMMHMGMWLMFRGKRVLLWVAVTLLGYTLVTVAVAGASRAGGGIGPLNVYNAIGTVAIVPLWVGLLMTAWSVVERELTTIRKALILIVLLMGALRMVDVANFMGSTATPPFWEEVMNSGATVTVWAAWAVTLECGFVCIWEGAAVVRERPAKAGVLGLFAALAAGLIVRELLMTLGIVGGSTLLGVTALPFMSFALLVVALDYVEAMRGASSELGSYDILGPLGHGGMGEVFLARRRGPAGFSRFIAIKKIRSKHGRDDPQWTERFLSEARLAAQLMHPNIVSVHDLGRTHDGWFIAMEYLSGVSLLQVRKRAADVGADVPQEFVVAVAAQVCRGLSRAHAAGIIHRDISPHNIMVTFEGTVKIVDFGIAKEHGAPEQSHSDTPTPTPTPTGSGDLTRTGIVVGKRAYLSPERVTGMQATASSDIFALGIVMYELLALRRPFKGDTPLELARAVLVGKYPHLRSLRPDIDPEVQRVVDMALFPRVADRYISAEAFLDDLHDLVPALPAIDLGRMIQEWFRDKWADEKAMFAGGLEPKVAAQGDLGAPDLEPSLPVTREVSAHLSPDDVSSLPVEYPETDD